MTKFLITGGNGFIGKHLIKALEKRFPNSSIEVFQEDLCKGFKNSFEPDIIYHLAANTNTRFPDDIEMYRTNILTFLHALQLASNKNAKLIYASSGAVYGNMGEILHAYGHSKLLIDEIAKRFQKKLPIVGLRFFNVYGPGEKHKGQMASIISQWSWQIKQNKSPVAFKASPAQRDFIYIKDVIKALLDAISLDSGIYDVGTGDPVSFDYVLKLVKETLGCKLKTTYIDNPYSNQTYQRYTKANLDWGFSPDYGIVAGIQDYLKPHGRSNQNQIS